MRIILASFAIIAVAGSAAAQNALPQPSRTAPAAQEISQRLSQQGVPNQVTRTGQRDQADYARRAQVEMARAQSAAQQPLRIDDDVIIGMPQTESRSEDEPERGPDR